MKNVKQNINYTAAKFEKENGARHAKLQALRDAGKIETRLFERLYAAEARWLERNDIKFSPTHRAWLTAGFVSEPVAAPSKKESMSVVDDAQLVFQRFVRVTFGARFLTDRRDNVLTTVSRSRGIAQISNADKVLRELSKKAALVKASTKGCVFHFGKGKKQAQVSVQQIGKVHVLTMKAM